MRSRSSNQVQEGAYTAYHDEAIPETTPAHQFDGNRSGGLLPKTPNAENQTRSARHERLARLDPAVFCLRLIRRDSEQDHGIGVRLRGFKRLAHTIGKSFVIGEMMVRGEKCDDGPRVYLVQAHQTIHDRRAGAPITGLNQEPCRRSHSSAMRRNKNSRALWSRQKTFVWTHNPCNSAQCLIKECSSPRTLQNCLGRSSPESLRVSGNSRLPSPPARITAHRWTRAPEGRLHLCLFVHCSSSPVVFLPNFKVQF